MKTYNNEEYPLAKETYLITGICMDIHRTLGNGFLEIVYKDALEYELKNRNIFFEREKEYKVKYKEVFLPHKFFADFVVLNNIIVEVKAQKGIIDEHYTQVINYIAVSNNPLAIIYNFGETSLKYKRVVLTKN